MRSARGGGAAAAAFGARPRAGVVARFRRHRCSPRLRDAAQAWARPGPWAPLRCTCLLKRFSRCKHVASCGAYSAGPPCLLHDCRGRAPERRLAARARYGEREGARCVVYVDSGVARRAGCAWVSVVEKKKKERSARGGAVAGARVQVRPQEGQKWQKMVFTVDRPNCALEEMRRGQREYARGDFACGAHSRVELRTFCWPLREL